MLEERLMRLALTEASKGLGGTGANPLVGALIHRDGMVMAMAYHQRFGGPHAEVLALEAMSTSPSGASMVVTLEPCCHYGKTPPCTQAILDAGIAELTWGMLDPNPLMSGQGLARLEAGGIRLKGPVLEEDCHKLNEPWLHLMKTGTPWVHLKLATSLDGRLACRTGDSRWVSGGEAAEYTHHLRAGSDAIMVGAGTLLGDNPSLDIRQHPHKKKLLRVVLDSRLQIPADSKVLNSPASGPLLIYCAPPGPPVGDLRFQRPGVEVQVVPQGNNGLCLDAVLKDLGARGVCRLMVEGGGRLAGAMLQGAMVNELSWIIAPKLIGADGVPSVNTTGLEKMALAPLLDIQEYRPLGADLLIRARPVFSLSPCVCPT